MNNHVHFPIGMNYAEDKYVLLWCVCVCRKIAYLEKAFYHYQLNAPNSLSAVYYTDKILYMAIQFRNNCIKEFPYPYNEIAALCREKGFYRKALLSDDVNILKNFKKDFSLLKRRFMSLDILFTNKLLLIIAFYISTRLAHCIIKIRMWLYDHIATNKT